MANGGEKSLLFVFMNLDSELSPILAKFLKEMFPSLWKLFALFPRMLVNFILTWCICICETGPSIAAVREYLVYSVGSLRALFFRLGLYSGSLMGWLAS